MKILVTIKQVPDTATQVKIGGDGKQIDTAGITWIVSPYDEFAVEEGLRIKEKRGQGEVVAVTLGPDRAKETLRSALAMGCDRAIHVNDPALATADTLTTARALAAVIKQEAPQLVHLTPDAVKKVPQIDPEPLLQPLTPAEQQQFEQQKQEIALAPPPPPPPAPPAPPPPQLQAQVI